MRNREGRERKEREKMREREREIVGLNSLRVLKKKKKFIPFSYSTILHLRWYYSYMSKKIWPFPIWPSHCWDFLGLYAKFILHLAYGGPARDALTLHALFVVSFGFLINKFSL